MKRAVKAYVVGRLGDDPSKYSYRISLDEFIPRCDVEVSWEVPDLKHACARIPSSYKIFDNGGWQISMSDGRFAAYIFTCPFCGEKLE